MIYMRNVFLVDFIEMAKVNYQSEGGKQEKKEQVLLLATTVQVFGFLVNSQS